MQNRAMFFRRVALTEAVSYLVLLGIAMPLKYAAGMPWAVRVVGSIHGALVIAFCWTLWRLVRDSGWPLRRAAFLFGASLVPFAPFVLDRRVKEWAQHPTERPLAPEARAS